MSPIISNDIIMWCYQNKYFLSDIEKISEKFAPVIVANDDADLTTWFTIVLKDSNKFYILLQYNVWYEIYEFLN